MKDAIHRQDWPTALSIANSLELETSFIHKHALSQQLSSTDPTDRLNLSSIETVLKSDPIWVARLIINLSQKPSPTSPRCSYTDEKKLIEILSTATDIWLDKLSTDRNLSLREVLSGIVESAEHEDRAETVKALIQEDEEVAEASLAKWVSVDCKSKWNIYEDLYRPAQSTSKNLIQDSLKHERPVTEDEPEEISNWGDVELDPIQGLDEAPDQGEPDGSFFSFCQLDLTDFAFTLASKLELDSLRKLIESGSIQIESTNLFDSIPLHARPSDMDYGQDLIALLPRPQTKFTPPSQPTDVIAILLNLAPHQSLLSNPTDQQLTEWYLSRVRAIDNLTGCIDTAIEIIQHGAASGVLGLESIAEDLSLLGKLLYDAPYASSEYDWTLDQWMSKSPEEIVEAYLAGSTPSSLIKDIHRLVLPYLGLLESRRARASIPGAEFTIPDGLRTWGLGLSNNLAMLEALIKASSPNLTLPERPIKSNEDLARILVSCFYTSSSLDGWESMGRMFECMPAFPDQIPTDTAFNSANYLHELLLSLSSSMCTRQGTHRVYKALLQLDTGRLSSILDGLDDHLATAEVLARWNVPARLGDLVIKYHGNKPAQQKLATRIARQEGGVEMESEEEWEALLEAMIELSQTGRALDLLGKEEIVRLFFSGLLTSGKFKLAKALFSSSIDDPLLDLSTQEELVIAASREFYDNAESGNLQTGEMKMAYDCLAVAPSSLNIKRERDFIEATSRLASFKIESQLGVTMSPIEIRLKTNKLDLIGQVLEASPTAYQHQDMIIDLVNKLGYKEDLLLQIKALSMMVDRAFVKEDLLIATQTCERMISILENMKKRSKQIESQSSIDESSKVVWRTCEKIGKHPQRFQASLSTLNTNFKTKFLAHAIIICPPDQIARLLDQWRQVEKEEDYCSSISLINPSQPSNRDIPSNSMLPESLWNSISEKSVTDSILNPPSSTSTKVGESLGLPGGDLASRTLERAASLFPFKSTTVPPLGFMSSSKTDAQNNSVDPNALRPDQHRNESERLERNFSEPLNSLVGDHQDKVRFGVGVDTDRLTTALSNKFTSGVGWLIGANEEDLR